VGAVRVRKQRSRFGIVLIVAGFLTILLSGFTGSASAAPSPAFTGSTVTWTGGGTTNGYCSQVNGEPTGSQTWQFNLTGIDSNGQNARLTASFDDGTSVSNLAPDQVNGGVAKWFVTTDAGAKLLSASADVSNVTMGDGNANLTVSHCDFTGTPTTTTTTSTSTTTTTVPETTSTSTTTTTVPETTSTSTSTTSTSTTSTTTTSTSTTTSTTTTTVPETTTTVPETTTTVPETTTTLPETSSSALPRSAVATTTTTSPVVVTEGSTTPGSSSAPTSAVSPTSAALPFTGSRGNAGLSLFGAALVLAGAVMLFSGRRSAPSRP
jgi:hypothetical protein